MRGLWVTLVAFGCGATRSRDDFMQRVATGEGPTVHEQYNVPRPLTDVEASLTTKNGECFGRTIYKDGAGAAPGTTTTSSNTYLAELGHSRDGVLQLTLRVLHSPRAVGSLEGGDFYLAADLRESDGATVVDLYAPTTIYEHIAAAVRSWIKGDAVDCPPLE